MIDGAQPGDRVVYTGAHRDALKGSLKQGEELLFERWLKRFHGAFSIVYLQKDERSPSIACYAGDLSFAYVDEPIVEEDWS